MTTNPPSADSTMRRQQLQTYAAALKSFSSSPSTFQILHSISSSALTSSANHPPPPPPPPPPPKTLYVLDSSFNPPTIAHLHMATSALLHDPQCAPGPKHLLLLLSIQNADKAPKPASFPHRLQMMNLFGTTLLSSLPAVVPTSSSSSPSPTPTTPNNQAPISGIDIAITKHPYFHSKALAIDASGSFPARTTTQVHLTGFDTLIRVLDPKYYPPEHTLEPLVPFLQSHRLRVTYRTGDSWGAKEAQDRYLRELGEGAREDVGGRRDWVLGGRIELCDGRGEGEVVVSSSRVREAVRRGDEKELRGLVPESVVEWILAERLYLDE